MESIAVGDGCGDHPQNRQLIKCRLNAVWSFQAKVVFWALFGLELAFIGIGVVGYKQIWPWYILLTLPVFISFVGRERRKLQSVVTVFLDQLAKARNLVKIHPADEPEKPTEAAQA